jgi:hypothetical protein
VRQVTEITYDGGSVITPATFDEIWASLGECKQLGETMLGVMVYPNHDVFLLPKEFGVGIHYIKTVKTITWGQ